MTNAQLTKSAGTAPVRSRKADKQIGWAVKLHVTYEYTVNKKTAQATDSIWIQGATKAATLANAIAEKAKQQSLTVPVSCWIESEMYPVTKPLL